MAGFTGSWLSPSTSFGNIQFKKQTDPMSDWQKYLENLNSGDQADRLGLGVGESPDQQDEAWNRWMSFNAGGMSPNAQNALRQNRGQLYSAFNQARASQPAGTDLRWAQFLGNVNPANTTNAWSPQTAFRPVTFRRVRVSGG